MKTAEEIVKEFAAKFIKTNWRHQEHFIDSSSKQRDILLGEIKKNLYDAMWVIDELSQWGMDKKHFIDVEVECGNHRIINLDGNYIMVDYIAANYEYKVTLMKREEVMVPSVRFVEFKED